MDKSIRPGRIAVLALLLAVLLVVFIVAIYKLQIIEGNEYYEESLNSVTTTQRVRAARGNILDRYGRVLISNTSANSLKLNYSDLKAQEDPNAAILRMVQLVEEAGDEYNDDLPVTMSPPFEYTDMTALQRMLLRGYLEDAKLAEDASAVELMSSFRNRFKINNNYTAEQMRVIAGIRYALEVRTIVNTADYIFVPNASMDLITALMENGLRGFEVTTSYQRVYNTTLAPHILGYVRPMTAEQYANTQDIEWQRHNKARAFFESSPKRQGYIMEGEFAGQCWEPGNQDEIVFGLMNDYDKDFLSHYGYSKFGDFVNPPIELAPYGEAWQIDKADIQKDYDDYLRIQDEQLPSIIMAADDAEFDAKWDTFVNDITPSADIYANFMHEQILKLVAAYYGEE